ncbi:MAG: hypothetical protein IT582_01250 [Opitutaceae bacterium]|nr:hypothetical protein [Opitutaceae bacterium]
MSFNTELRLFATAWSLREYPSKLGEWTWAEKFAAIRAAGFDGIMSPPRAELAERGDLEYWAMGSLGAEHDAAAYFNQAAGLGAKHATIQLCDVDTPLAEAVTVAEAVIAAARATGVGVTIESHRDTFTETPERMWALCDAFQEKTGGALPVCLDHSHFAVVRHFAAPYWPKLNERPDVLARCGRFHLRPFTGHHCQIPATLDGVRPTPEYELWGEFVSELFGWLRANGTIREICVCPELGNAAPAYGLSCFPDVWRDACYIAADLKRRWAGRF